MLGLLLAAAIVAAPPVQEVEPRHARGVFVATLTPAADAVGPAGHFRMTLSKTFSGGMAGVASGEMLATLDDGQSGAYVALERFEGVLEGRDGGFSLAHRGLMDRGAPDLSIVIVPGSGFGELGGISGVFHLEIVDGEHRYDLEYRLPPVIVEDAP